MKAIGCVGMISNGPSRDLDEVRPMGFQYMLTGVTAGHGAMAVQAINVPVSVASVAFTACQCSGTPGVVQWKTYRASAAVEPPAVSP